MNITEEHLHHMARRHHATMKKLDAFREKFSGFKDVASKLGRTAETAAGAWLGGAIEGRTGGASFGPLPINLGAGALLLVGSHMSRNWADGQYSAHLDQLGNGFVGSYLAATGYAFGKRWKETKSVFGGGGHPWAQPYENGWQQAPAPTP